jgi:cytochrome c peroxidase
MRAMGFVMSSMLGVACLAVPDEGLGRRPSIPVAAKTSGCSTDPRVTLGLVSEAVCTGADLFFREPFGGNGRTCATCHPASHNFTIDATFIATLPPGDPLFVAETVPALATLEVPALMRSFGLIRENLDGFGDLPNRFVMRSVPHVFAQSISITAELVPTDGTTRPPNERTGWGGDGAPNAGELRDFPTGAITQHYTQSLARVSGTDFVLATSSELDAIVAFLATIGRTNDMVIASVTLTDAGAEAGRIRFQDADARCNGCHRNAGARNGAGINRNFNTGVETARIATLDTLAIPHDGGFGVVPTSGGALGNGTFNTPPLVEAADTGPWFHTNGFGPQIEDAIAFYTTAAFAGSPSGNGVAIPLTALDIANIGRFLRVVNASMNCQLALARIAADIAIIGDQKNHERDLQQTLAALAGAEVADAITDLSGVVGLHASAQVSLLAAQVSLQCAATHASHVHRLGCAQDALAAVTVANASLGTGLTLTMGAGSLMF